MSELEMMNGLELPHSLLDIIASKAGTKHIVRNERGFLHNENGPAMITENGANFWVLEGKMCSNFEEWCETLGKTDEEIVRLKLEYNTNE